MTAFVSFFRGINVGGQHKVRMAELKELHESLGLKDVLTYIQSGNVVFSSGEESEAGEADVEDVERLRRQIEDGFEQKFGFHSDVFVRSSAELEEIIENNPFHNQPDKAPGWIVVMFLGARPEEAAQKDLKDLLETYVGPEELFVIGKELHVYYANGIGRSKLMPGLLEKKLKTVGTARNWNTILKLQELMQR